MTRPKTTLQLSRWCKRIVTAHPDWLPQLQALADQPIDANALQALLQTERAAKSVPPIESIAQNAYESSAHLQTVLRRVRAKALYALIDRDLSGRADLSEVMIAMTALGELSVQEALAWNTHELVRLHGEPIGSQSGLKQDLIVVGMGKFGGVELNVSSDIDLIFVYPEDGETAGLEGQAVRSISNHEFFTLLGRKLITALNEATADGFVFRVDMRLRPNGDSGPLAASFAMLAEYFLKQGRDWERFAWIKGRIVSQPVLGGLSLEQQTSQLDAIVHPFVYRRYLDFGTIASLRNLHGQIRAEVARQETKVTRSASGEVTHFKPVNVKLGRGGIREVEFIVQHFQVIRGGRDIKLRNRSTLTMLQLLVQRNMLDDDTAERLAKAYIFLRNVEHRLQYLDDAQTHVLPRDDEARALVAAMCAPYLNVVPDTAHDENLVAALVTRIATEQAFVAETFDEVFGEKKSALVEDVAEDAVSIWSERLAAPMTEAARAQLASLGFTDIDMVWSRLRALWLSRSLRILTVPSRERIDLLMPRAIEAATRCSAPDATLGRLLDLIEAISGRGPYVSFLNEFPHALERVAQVLAASPWAAHYLTGHPLLLDELLDLRPHELPDFQLVAQNLQAELELVQGDVERQMDLLRETHHAQVFRLLTQDLQSRMTVETLSDQLSALADLIVDAAIDVAWKQLNIRHQEVPRFAVIAYGKLGGKELGYASDLDIIFLYDDEHERASEIYARLAQRLISVLTTRTTAGALFEIDLALRPDGGSGLLVSSLSAYRKYQNESAWLWEHQALTRTRFCAGDRELGLAFEQVRRSVLSQPRELDKLRKEIVAMRKKMHDAHPNKTGQFDLKHDAGGMIDIEFATQYLVLAHGHAHAELLDDAGNIALVQRAAAAGLLDMTLARQVADAYRAYRKRQHGIRLAGSASDMSGSTTDSPARVSVDEFKAEREAVQRLWYGLFES